MKIAITGEKGFLGIHLTHYFKHVLKYEVIKLGRDYLNELTKQTDLDWLIHAAFIHRHPEPEKVLELNNKLTQDTINCLKQNNINCNICFLSSIQEGNNSPYGEAKLNTKKIFEAHCLSINKTIITLRLPNVFGEYAVPHKTSFIASFCYNLHNNLPVKFNKNKVALSYVHDIIPIIANLKQVEIPVTKTTVDEVYFILNKFNKINKDTIFSELNTKLEIDLYNTYLQYTNYKI